MSAFPDLSPWSTDISSGVGVNQLSTCSRLDSTSQTHKSVEAQVGLKNTGERRGLRTASELLFSIWFEGSSPQRYVLLRRIERVM